MENVLEGSEGCQNRTSNGGQRRSMAGASAAREADMHTVDARVGVHKDVVSTSRARTQQSRFVHSYFTAARW